MTSSTPSGSSETITNIVFGIAAIIISILTVWQGHRAWTTWRAYRQDRHRHTPDIELGDHVSLAISQREEHSHTTTSTGQLDSDLSTLAAVDSPHVSRSVPGIMPASDPSEASDTPAMPTMSLQLDDQDKLHDVGALSVQAVERDPE